MTAATSADDWPEWSTSDLIERVNEGQLMEDSACPTCLCPAAFHQKIVETNKTPLDFGGARVRLYCPRDVFDSNGARIEKAVSGYWERMGKATRMSPYQASVNTYLLQAQALRRLDDVDAQAKALLSIANAERRAKFNEALDLKRKQREERIEQTGGMARLQLQQMANDPSKTLEVLKKLYGEQVAQQLLSGKELGQLQERISEDAKRQPVKWIGSDAYIENKTQEPEQPKPARKFYPKKAALPKPRVLAKRKYDFEE